MIISGDIHEKGLRPLSVGKFTVNGWHGIDGGRVDYNIDAAELGNREVRSVGKGCRGAEIRSDVGNKLGR
jgi:hypothetical protein